MHPFSGAFFCSFVGPAAALQAWHIFYFFFKWCSPEPIIFMPAHYLRLLTMIRNDVGVAERGCFMYSKAR